jgi:hypothetical protein
MKKTLIATAIAATLAVPAFAGAPPTPLATPAQAPNAGQLKHEERVHEVQEKIAAFMVGELTSRLSLDATKSAKLSDAIKAHMERKHANEKAMHQAMQKLGELVEEKAPDAQVKQQLDVVLGAKASEGDEIGAFVNDTQKFLTVQEQAKMALAMPDIMKEVGRMRHEMREEFKGKAGPGGFGGRPLEE